MHVHILDRVRAVRPLLCRADELVAAGKTGDAVRREIASGRLHRVSHGWYVDQEDWQAQYAEGRHLIQVAAALAAHERSPIFSHVSAAALHGLPLFRMPLMPVHTTCPPNHRSKSTAHITRHVADLGSKEIVEVGSVRLTSLTRTLIDLLRTAPPAIAIGGVDAVLRAAATRAPAPAPSRQRRAHTEVAASSLRDDLLGEINLQPGARGNVQARALLSIADGRSDSVVESVSRLFLLGLGFDVQMQVPVEAPHGSSFWVDFEFKNMGVFGEVDGFMKYRDPALRKNRSAEEVIIDEKRREDWIRGVTGKRIVRWSPADLSSPNALRDRLASFGIHPPIGRRGRSTR